MRFGIRDIADVDEIGFLRHAERLGYDSVRVTDTIFLSRERVTSSPRAVFLPPPKPSDGSSHEVE